jgi:hypothetical protein
MNGYWDTSAIDAGRRIEFYTALDALNRSIDPGKRRRPAAANSRLHGVIFYHRPQLHNQPQQTVAVCYGFF